jgi:hypothetical protein
MHSLPCKFLISNICGTRIQGGLSRVPLRNISRPFQFRPPGTVLPGCIDGRGHYLLEVELRGPGEPGLVIVLVGVPHYSQPFFFPCLFSRDPEIRSPAPKREGQVCLEFGYRGTVLRCECEISTCQGGKDIHLQDPSRWALESGVWSPEP